MSALKLLFLTLWIVPLLLLAWRARGRNVADTGLLAGFIALYVFHYRSFVFGREFVFHDTLWAHHGLYTVVAQWIASGYAIGWNSFLNGGEPFYVLSNYFLWAELLGFAWLNRFAGIPVHELVNLYFSYVLISFAVFCFCLFSAVLRDRLVVFYAMIPVLFGGLTPSTYGQYVLSPLYFVPLALLCAWRAAVERSVLALAWLGFFVAVTMNHYLPHYLALSAGAVLACAAAVEWLRRRRRGPAFALPRAELAKAAAVVLLCVAVAAPAVFVYRELGGWVAPTRGNAPIGTYGQGHQPSVHLTPAQYPFLVDLPRVSPAGTGWDNLAYHHSVFFIGWIPVALALYSVTGLRDPRYVPWLLATLLLAVISLGQPADVWAQLRAHVPLFHVRHLYPLALTVTLLMIVLSGFGLARLRASRALKAALAAMTLIVCLHAQGRLSYADPRYQEPFAVRPFEHPDVRELYSRKLSAVPLDVEPLVAKRASAAHRRDDFVLLRAGSWHRLLADGLPVTAGPMFGFAERLSWSPPPREAAASVLPNGSFEAWTSGRDGVRQLEDLRIAVQGAPRPVATEHRDSRDVRTGAASLRLSLPGGDGRAEIAAALPGLGGPEDEFAVVGACLRSDRRVSVSAELTWRTVPPAPGDPARRVPHEDHGPVGVLYEHVGSEAWDCFRRVVSLRGHAPGIELVLRLTSERPATVYLDDLELRPLPARAFEGPKPLAVERVAGPDPDHVVVRVTMPADGYLVRRENVHRGWRTVVDGEERPIEPYAGTLQAVRLSRGTHTVEWAFASPYPALMWTHAAAVLVGYVAFAFGRVVETPRSDDGEGTT